MSSTVSATSSTTPSTSSASSTTKSSGSPLFQASGLASGINTASVVDALIAGESAPLNRIKQRQADYNVQISTIGTLVTQLQALQTAASNLSKNGVASILPTSTFSDFTVTGSAKSEGSYTINVQQVAKAAKLQLSPLASAQDASLVADGNLQFSIDGTLSAAIDTTGKTLADVAEAINQNISGVSASVISTTSGYVLNISRSATGYTTTPSGALSIVADPGLGTWTSQDAQNARVNIDGLTIERTSNTISDAVPGATLRLTGASRIDNAVTFAADSSGTEEALNGFVDAYNTLAATVRSQLVTDPKVAYGDTLLNHTAMTTIQRAMQGLTSQLVVPTGSVRTLADLGLELQQDGTLSLNTFALDKAITSNAAAANAIFSTATKGIAAVVGNLVKAQTNSLTGSLSQQKLSLQSSISEMDDQVSSWQTYLDNERARLVNQFTAMENLVKGFNSAATYLTQIANLKTNS